MKKLIILSIFLLCLMSSLPIVQAVTYARYEYYITGEDSYSSVYEYRMVSQIFTPTSSHDLAYVRLLLGKIGNPQTVMLYIATVTDGVPDTVLSSGIFDSNKIVTSPLMEWYRIDLDYSITVNASISYAIILHAPSGNYTLNNILAWATDSEGSYTVGNLTISTDGGSNWDGYSAYDCLFETWGFSTALPITVVFPQFFTMMSSAIIPMALGISFSQIGGKLGEHEYAGFLIGGSMGLIIIANAGFVPMWFVFSVFVCGFVAMYFWIRSN